MALAQKLSWERKGSGWSDYYSANGFYIASTGKIFSIKVGKVANKCYMSFLDVLGKGSGGMLYKIKDGELIRYQEYLFGEVRAIVGLRGLTLELSLLNLLLRFLVMC